MNIDFLCKEYEEFYHFKCYVIWEAYQMLPIAHWPVRIQGIGEDMPNNMLSFINFEPLELYWTYFLAPPNHDSQNSLDETHELGSWAKNEMMCYELEP